MPWYRLAGIVINSTLKVLRNGSRSYLGMLFDFGTFEKVNMVNDIKKD